MDVSNLIPANQPSRANDVAARSRSTDATVGSTPPAAGAPLDAAPARPVPPLGAAGDRIERSPDLERDVAALQSQLGELPRLRQEQVAKLRSELDANKAATSETLASAALGILQGEFYFLQS